MRDTKEEEEDINVIKYIVICSVSLDNWEQFGVKSIMFFVQSDS